MSFDPQQDIYSLRNETGFLSPRQSAYVQRKRAELVNPQIELNLKLQANDRAQRAADLAYEQGMFEMDMKKKAFADAEVANKNLNELIAKIPSITEDNSLSPLDQSIAINNAFMQAGPSIANSPYFSTYADITKSMIQAKVAKSSKEQEDRDRAKQEEIRIEGIKRQDLKERRGDAIIAMQSVQTPELLSRFETLMDDPNTTSADWLKLGADATQERVRFAREEAQKRQESLDAGRLYDQQKERRAVLVKAAEGAAKNLASSVADLETQYNNLGPSGEAYLTRIDEAVAAAGTSSNTAPEKARNAAKLAMAEERNNLIKDWIEANVLPNGEKAVLKGKTFYEQKQSLLAQIEAARMEEIEKSLITSAPPKSATQEKTDSHFGISE